MAVNISGPIVLIGAGNMGGAMLTGWLKSGVPGSSVIVVDPGPSEAMLALIADAGAKHVTAAPEGMQAGVLFLAVKPQLMDAVLPPLKALVGPQTVVVSVAAGKTLAYLASHLGAAAMVRAMPNTPAMIGRGVTGAFANADVSEAQHAEVQALLQVSGPVEWSAAKQTLTRSRPFPAAVRHMFSISSSAWRRQVAKLACRRTSPCASHGKPSRGLGNC